MSGGWHSFTTLEPADPLKVKQIYMKVMLHIEIPKEHYDILKKMAHAEDGGASYQRIAVKETICQLIAKTVNTDSVK